MPAAGKDTFTGTSCLATPPAAASAVRRQMDEHDKIARKSLACNTLENAVTEQKRGKVALKATQVECAR